MLTQPLIDSSSVEDAALLQQSCQRRLHFYLAAARRQLQQTQVFLVRPLWLPLQQQIVGHAEAAGGKQVGTVTIVGESPWLADQPVDDVPVVDLVLVTAPQPRHLLHAFLGVPQIDALGIQPSFDPLANQSAGHRVDVALHPDGTACFHPHTQAFACFQPLLRQRSQQGDFFGQARLPAAVELNEQLLQVGCVAVAASEVATATQHQGLVQSILEAVMPLLDVAVLVAFASPNGLGRQPIMAEQSLVTPLEDVGVGPRLHGSGQTVGAMQLRHPSQLPQRVLQAFAETLVAFGEADGSRLPVGVGQDEVVDQMRKGDASQGNAQVGAVSEIGGGQSSGMMNLGKEDLFGRPVFGPPAFESPLQSAQLAIGEASRVVSLESREEGLGL